MTPSRREEALFVLALEKTVAERARWLEHECADDTALRRRVEALLAAHEQATGFLPADASADTLLDPSQANASAHSPDEKEGSLIGRYKLLEKLGEGGFGAVWLAEQKEPVRRKVALKIIKLGMDTKQVVARFEAERQALALMDHPNIAKVFDAGTTETPHPVSDHPLPVGRGEGSERLSVGRPYFVMELVRGIPMTKFCDENSMPTRERLDLFIKVCHAIQHAHQKGIIHRDIKPSNVMVTLHDGVPVPKVIDFGIAKATQGELTDKTIHTQFQQFIGTPAYMSPEQAEMSGLDIDTRSDIYSLGVLLYELLTGKTPFDAKELVASGIDAMRKTIREKEPPRPSTRLATLGADELTTAAKRRSADTSKLLHQLKGDLDWIVMKCLEKDRQRRYETANGLAADLKRHLDNEPVIARPPSAAYRFQKAFRRNKLTFAAVTAVALALLVGLGMAAIGWRQTRVERDKALRAKTQAQAAQRDAEKSQQAEKEAHLEADLEKAEARRLFYGASMNLAQQAWEKNNIGLLRELLEETKESPSRGFEWFFWQQLCHSEFRTLSGHLAVVSQIAFSPDGQRIATGSDDYSAKVWETSTGRELFTLRGHKHYVRGLAFSPNGQQIVTGSLDYLAKGWDANSGREIFTLKGHQSGVIGAGFSADGQRIVTMSDDATARIWDAATGGALMTLRGHSGAVRFAVFSTDGQRVVTRSDDQTVKVWEASTGRELFSQPAIPLIAFSADGRRFVTGSGDETARVWDAPSGRELLTLKGHTTWIRSVAISRDGQRIVTGSDDQTARVWDAVSGRELLPPLKGHSASIWSVAFSPDGQRIITLGQDKTAKIWDAKNGQELLSVKGMDSVIFTPDSRRIVTTSSDATIKVLDGDTGRESLTLKGHTSPISALVFSPDSQRIVTGSSDKTAKVWTTDAQRGVLSVQQYTNAIRSVAFSPDARWLVTGGDDQTARVWEVGTGRELMLLKKHKGEITSIGFSSDGRRIVSGSQDNTAILWDSQSGRELRTLTGHRGWIRSVDFSPNGERIVTASRDRTAKIWDANTGRELLTLEGHTSGVSSVRFSPNGQWIATGSWDKTARLWDAVTGRKLGTFGGHADIVTSLSFSPDGRRVVTGSRDGLAKVWETATGNEMLTLRGHTANIRSVAFSADGLRIVSGSDDQTVKVWETSAGGELLTLRGHTDAINAVAFSTDGQRIASGGSDGTAKVWTRASASQITAWVEDQRLAEKRLTEFAHELDQAAKDQRLARANDEGAIKHWLILAPIPISERNVGIGLDQQQIAEEAKLRPRAGEKAVIGAGEFIWNDVHLPDYLIAFNELLGEAELARSYDFCVAYAVCYLVAERAQSNLTMRIGSDDEAKVYLNGRKVFESRVAHAWVADADEARGVALTAGINVLVFKVVNEKFGWQGSLRMTDQDDNPVKGIKVTLDPEAKVSQ